MANTQKKPGLGTLALHAGQEPDPTTTAPGRPDLRHHELRLSTTPSTPANLFGCGIRQHLLAADEPHQRRAGKALAALDGGSERWPSPRDRRPSPRPSWPSHTPGRTSSPPPASTAAPGRCSRRRSKSSASRCASSIPTVPKRSEARGREHPAGLSGIGRQSEKRRAGLPAIADIAHAHGLPVIDG